MQQKEARLIRAIPGRVRFIVCHLKGNRVLAAHMTKHLQRVEGIQHVECSVITGTLLVRYDVRLLSIQDMEREVQAVHRHNKIPSDMTVGWRETAAFSELSPIRKDMLAAGLMHQGKTFADHSLRTNPKVPLPLMISVAGLGFLTIKQMMVGRTALASSPALFYLSGILSIVSGYSFVNRGVKRFLRDRQIPMDVLLGTGVLVFGLLRENLVVLAGLSLLQYVNWKQQQLACYPAQQPIVPKDIREYIEKTSKRGFLFAAMTLGMTGNPLFGLGILLAANPRPVLVATDYAWKQAEVVSMQRGYMIPKDGSLEQLSRTKTIVFEDTALMFEPQKTQVQCMSYGDEQEVWSLAAAVLEKTGHFWRDAVMKKALESGKTIRTAFAVKQTQEGVTVQISGMTVYCGTIKFMKQHQVNIQAYQLETKRLQKLGYEVILLGKQVADERTCIGILIAPTNSFTKEFQQLRELAQQQNWNIGVIENQMNIDTGILIRNNIVTSWLTNDIDQLEQRLQSENNLGNEIVLVKKQLGTREHSSPYVRCVPSIDITQVNDLYHAVVYANRMKQVVYEHLAITKVWNVVGSVLAVPLTMYGAPIANIMSDSISLIFLSRAKRISETATA
ncbi:hypothetical protein LSG31_07295 [Fodinisporobacter ferrooxydans]|uniref:HMA domain-containing protein n=1 Tax=Fodinisporobacter ferrooxydans TaxID=2901836 RepID=A0ABY4CNK8_9BACL|nr:hypothetical protein LSG31_07295 [Alicyclobacillaceae bacterium MYW30-H2]